MLEFLQQIISDNNIKIISVILIAFLMAILLFIIIILYVKSIATSMQNEKSEEKGSASFFLNEDEESLVNNLEREKELELEQERELERVKEERVKQEKIELVRQNHVNEERELREKDKKANEKNESNVALDWQKGNASQTPCASAPLQYQQSQKPLNELLGLIVDMVSRGVDELKIAQTVMHRNQGQSSEDDILQTITTIKDFIALSVNRRFSVLRNKSNLPSEEAALLSLVNGDPSLSMALMEGLMEYNIDAASQMSAGDKRNSVFSETSNIATAFGSFAKLNDPYLAGSSFELAIELNPQNINAWGRLGDVYGITDSHSQSVWAYENLLNISDEGLHPRQVANAKKMLSKYAYDKGDNLNAAKLYNNSKAYYDSIGINRRLDRHELEIVEVIEAKHAQNIKNTVSHILSNKGLSKYSYG